MSALLGVLLGAAVSLTGTVGVEWFRDSRARGERAAERTEKQQESEKRLLAIARAERHRLSVAEVVFTLAIERTHAWPPLNGLPPPLSQEEWRLLAAELDFETWTKVETAETVIAHALLLP